jgi:hypothetical protein
VGDRPILGALAASSTVCLPWIWLYEDARLIFTSIGCTPYSHAELEECEDVLCAVALAERKRRLAESSSALAT